MLERIVETGHLDELDGSVEVMREPQLFEMGDVSQVPEDGTHQGIVLDPEIVIRQRSEEQESAGSGFLELATNGLTVHPGKGYSGHSWTLPSV
jgi:hypothetical protein